MDEPTFAGAKESFFTTESVGKGMQTYQHEPEQAAKRLAYPYVTDSASGMLHPTGAISARVMAAVVRVCLRCTGPVISF